MKVKKVTYAGKADVFNMEVETTHDFVTKGGIVAHNCADEWRYACMTRPVAPILEIKKELPLNDPLNQLSKRRY